MNGSINALSARHRRFETLAARSRTHSSGWIAIWNYWPNERKGHRVSMHGDQPFFDPFFDPASPIRPSLGRWPCSLDGSSRTRVRPPIEPSTVWVMSTTDDPIHGTLHNWHLHLRREFPGGLDALLHDDVVFFSPVVFTPQQGKAITIMYLQAAAGVFPGDAAADSHEAGREPSLASGSFRYTKEVASGHTAVLEFETEIEGKYVNGVDIITCDDDGMIVEFRVMIRPLQAVNAIHQNMMAMLEKMSG